MTDKEFSLRLAKLRTQNGGVHLRTTNRAALPAVDAAKKGCLIG